MRDKIRRIWKKIKPSARGGNPVRSKNQKNELRIPIAGVKKQEVKISKEEGFILIDAQYLIAVEEKSRFRPWKMYNSFGFYRSFFLPEGIEAKDVTCKLDKNEVRIVW